MSVILNGIMAVLGIYLLTCLLQFCLNKRVRYHQVKKISKEANKKISKLVKKQKWYTAITILLSELGVTYIVGNTNVISVFSIIILSIILFIFSFYLSYCYFHIITTAFIVASFCALLPFYGLRYLVFRRRQRILKMFPNYVLCLKNYTDVTNDITLAIKKAVVEEPLLSYINTFTISVDRGIKVYEAFERLKQDIQIKKISQWISLLQFCHYYGGDFSQLLDKFSKIQIKTNLQKEKEKQAIFSSKLVLLLLLAINLYIIFGFIMASQVYYAIITNTLIGKIILNVNILSYAGIMYLYMKLNQLEE